MAPAQENPGRATALRHAYDLEEKKRIQREVTDLIIECFDLPSANLTPQSEDNPSHTPVGAKTFKRALSLFQPSDFDDLVYERNVDARCGYALCSRPNRKLGTAKKVWNGKAGSEFRIVDRTELEKWCSDDCAKKAAFAKSQLSPDPAWVREEPVKSIKLLDDSAVGENRIDEASNEAEESNLAERLRTLALERAELGVQEPRAQISVVEKEPTAEQIPLLPDVNMEDAIEGCKPRKVRFVSGGG